MRSILAAVAVFFGLSAALPAVAQTRSEASTEQPANPDVPPKVDLADLLESLSELTPDIEPPAQPGYDPTKPVVGFGIASNAAGAKINVIVPGSAAERAGLKEGMTILSINGIWLTGFQTAEVVKILGAIKGEIAFYVDTGQTISLTKAPIVQAGE